MAVNHVELHNHRKTIPSAFRGFVEEAIKTLITDTEVYKVDVYNMDGTSRNIVSGDSSRLIILANANTPIEGGIDVKIDDVVVGYFRKDDRQPVHQFNIASDVFSDYTDLNKEAFTHIIKALNAVYTQALLDYSWKSTSKKEELTNEFTAVIKEQQGRFIRDDEQRLNEAESSIRSYTRSLKEKFDLRTRYMINIESAKAKLETVSEGLIKDLDNIIAHPKVKELFIKDGKFVVHTEPLYMYHDRTGDRYYLGNMRIEMNPQNTEVKFFGDNPRKSYWTDRDPHPHVNGRSGEACLGNVGATIAELCSQMELYALTMIGIDFLEATNTSDSAGKHITNWDMVDEEGKVIKRGGTRDTWECQHCGSDVDEDEHGTNVYVSYEGGTDGNGTWGDEIRVCDDCRSDHYTYRDALDEYVRDGECDIEENEEDEEEDEE